MGDRPMLCAALDCDEEAAQGLALCQAHADALERGELVLAEEDDSTVDCESCGKSFPLGEPMVEVYDGTFSHQVFCCWDCIVDYATTGIDPEQMTHEGAVAAEAEFAARLGRVLAQEGRDGA